MTPGDCSCVSGGVHGLWIRVLCTHRGVFCALVACAGVSAGCDCVSTISGGLETAHAVDTSSGTEVRGFIRRTFPDEVGNSRGYVAFLPHDQRSSRKLPVLLFLNGVGENGDDGISLGNNFGMPIWEMQEFFPFLAIAPQCRPNGSWVAGSPDVTWALQVLDAVIEEFDGDKDRVYLTGVSAGGIGVWSVGAAYPERFAALVPLCGSAGGDVSRLVKARLPVWNFYNDQDDRGLVMSNRNIRQQLIELGSSPFVSEYPAEGHNCWNRGYRNSAMYAWLLEQSRSRNAMESPFDYLPSERLLTEWNRQGPGEWTVEEDGVLVGRSCPAQKEGQTGVAQKGGQTPGHTAGRGQTPFLGVEHEPGLLVSDTASRSLEIHGDVWMQPESVCRIALLNAEPSIAQKGGQTPFARVGGQTPLLCNAVERNEPADGLWLSLMLPDLGTGGVARSNGEWLARLDPAAQRALQAKSWNDVRVRL